MRRIKKPFVKTIALLLFFTFASQQIACAGAFYNDSYRNLSLNSRLPGDTISEDDHPAVGTTLTEQRLRETAKALGLTVEPAVAQAVEGFVERTRTQFRAWKRSNARAPHNEQFEALAGMFVSNMRPVKGRFVSWVTPLLGLARDELFADDSSSQELITEFIEDPDARATSASLTAACQRHGIAGPVAVDVRRVFNRTREILVGELKQDMVVWERGFGPRGASPYEKEIWLVESEANYGLGKYPIVWPALYRDVIVQGALLRDRTDGLCSAIDDLVVSINNETPMDPGEIFLTAGGQMDDWPLFNGALVPFSGCGIISYFGYRGGVTGVIEAETRLTYRAPDSTGIGTVTEDGDITIRRQLKTPIELIQHLYWNPLFRLATVPGVEGQAVPVASLSPERVNDMRR